MLVWPGVTHLQHLGWSSEWIPHEHCVPYRRRGARPARRISCTRPWSARTRRLSATSTTRRWCSTRTSPAPCRATSVAAASNGGPRAGRLRRPVQGRRGLPRAVRRLHAVRRPTIRGELRRHFRDHGWLVRPPRSAQEADLAVRTATPQLTQTLGREPKDADLAAHLGLTREEVTRSGSPTGPSTASPSTPRSAGRPSPWATCWDRRRRAGQPREPPRPAAGPRHPVGPAPARAAAALREGLEPEGDR